MGSDSVRHLGYVYNAPTPDAVYGTSPPAVGLKMLAGASLGLDSGILSATAINTYIGGNDPQTPEERWNLLRGLHVDGSPWIDPTNSQPTTFVQNGNPLAGTGWNAAVNAETRVMVCSGPFSISPGLSQEVAVALIVSQGNDA